MKVNAGAQVGKYAIVRLIGRGGMGIVYLAEDTTLGRQIALKVLDRSFTDDGQFERRFQQEARVVASLQHPNIVTIHSLERIDDVLAIDMPYLEGGSMGTLSRGTAAAKKQAIGCMYHALMALACCHGEGIVHRDVKPSNILMRRDGVAMLSDFGLAKLLAEQQAVSLAESCSSGFFLGTPRYAPPESWDGQEATPTWDVYSAGMILYETFAPRIPYDAPTPLGLVKQIIEQPVPTLIEVSPDVSPAFSNAIAAMMDRDPARRPQDALEALELLKDSPEWGDAPSENQATVAARLTRPRRRRASVSTRRDFFRTLAARSALGGGAFALIAVVVSLLLYGRQGLDRSATPVDAAGRAGNLPGTGGIVYDTVDLAGTAVWPSHLLALKSESADRWTLLGYQDSQIWMLHILQSGLSTFDVSGEWGGYADQAASAFQHGEITGSGRWIVQDEEAAVSLEFRNLQTGLRQSRAHVLKRSREALSEEDYLRRFVSADFSLAIVYNELFPRNLRWGEELESIFLTRLSPRLIVPRLSVAETGAALDNVFQEAVWSPLFLNAGSGPGLLRGMPGAAGAWLCVRHDDAALYCAVRMEHPPADSHVRLTLAPLAAVRTSSVARWSVVADLSGIRAARFATGSTPRPWVCPWQVELSATSERLEAVVRFPFSSLEGVTVPEPGERWRLVCQVSDGQTPGATPVAWWGTDELDVAGEGVILAFGAEPGD